MFRRRVGGPVRRALLGLKDEVLVVNLEPHDFQEVGGADFVSGNRFPWPKLYSKLSQEFRQVIIASVLVIGRKGVQPGDHLVDESGWVASKGFPELLEAV